MVNYEPIKRFNTRTRCRFLSGAIFQSWFQLQSLPFEFLRWSSVTYLMSGLILPRYPARTSSSTYLINLFAQLLFTSKVLENFSRKKFLSAFTFAQILSICVEHIIYKPSEYIFPKILSWVDSDKMTNIFKGRLQTKKSIFFRT